MYVPHNTDLYLKANAGFMGGITAPANTDVHAGDYTLYAQMADAYAQQVDTVWGAPAPTSYDLDAILEVSEAVWAARSPLGAVAGILPGSYTQVAEAVVARVQQANAQIVSEGIDPNGGGVPGGVTNVTGTAPITSTGGATPAIGITPATDGAAGSMSAADKTKLDGIAPGAAVSAVTGAAPIISSGGDTPAISISPATDSTAGSLSAADKTKLDAIGPTLVNVVQVFGADPTGATDNSIAFQNAFNTLAGTGLIPYVPGGTYLFTTGITAKSNLTVMLSAGAILNANLANSGPFGPANILISAIPTFAVGSTTLSAAANPGDTAVTLTSVAGLANGNELFVELDPGTGAGFVRTITNIAGFVVSLDEPIASPYPIGALAQVVLTRLKNFRIIGNGGTAQGACQRLFELAAADNCSIEDLTLLPTNAPAWCASFDTASRNCVWRRIVTRGPTQGITLEGNEDGIIEQCAHYMTGTAAVIAFTLNDCVGCSVINCFGFGQEATGQVGVLLGSEEGDGNWGCTVRGGQFVGFPTAINLSSTTAPTVDGVRLVGNTYGVIASTGCLSASITNCDLSENNVIGIALQSSAKGTIISHCRLGGGPNTQQSILAQGDCVIVGCTSINGIPTSSIQNCLIKAQEDGSGYRPLVEVVGGDFVLDAASGNATSIIGSFGARMRVSGVHYSVNQVNCRGFLTVDGLSGTHSLVTHGDCTFTGSAAADAVYCGPASTVRIPRNDLGGFTFTIASGGFSDRGQVVANGASNVAIPWPDLQTEDRVVLSMAAKGGAPTALPLVTYTPGTGFTIQSFAGDTSTYDYIVI